MREILFRGKRVDNSKWIYGNLIDNEYIVGEMVDFDNDYFATKFWYRVEENTVGQSTGLKDVNGTIIYEGDIITDSNYFYDNSAPVVWNDVEAQFIADYEEEPMNIWPECKVIGNIHDTQQGDNA